MAAYHRFMTRHLQADCQEPDQLWNLMLGNRVWATLTFYILGGYTISVCNQPTRSTQPLLPSGVTKSSTRFGWGNGVNVTSAGWQVTLCDPI